MKSWGIPPRRHPLVCVLYSEWKSHAAWQHDHMTGWWFQTCLISHNIWDNTSHWLILFKMVKTTNQMMSILLVQLCLLVGSMILMWVHFAEKHSIWTPGENTIQRFLFLFTSHLVQKLSSFPTSRHGMYLDYGDYKMTSPEFNLNSWACRHGRFVVPGNKLPKRPLPWIHKLHEYAIQTISCNNTIAN